MRKFIIIITFITIIAFSLSAEALHLVDIGRLSVKNRLEDTATTATIEVDMDSIVLGPDNSKEVWSRMVYTTPECNPRYWGEGKCTKEQWFYERFYQTKTICTLEMIGMHTDKTMSKRKYTCEETMERITPASIRELMWKTIYGY